MPKVPKLGTKIDSHYDINVDESTIGVNLLGVLLGYLDAECFRKPYCYKNFRILNLSTNIYAMKTYSKSMRKTSILYYDVRKDIVILYVCNEHITFLITSNANANLMKATN